MAPRVSWRFEGGAKQQHRKITVLVGLNGAMIKPHCAVTAIETKGVGRV